MRKEQPVPGVPGAVWVEVSSLPAALEGGVRVGLHSQARPGALLADVPGVGRFLATDGQLIEFCAAPGADAISVRMLLGGVRAALVMQRRGLPLHAACLVPPGHGGAVALCGQRGAGKSTMAAELMRRGWRLLGDDLTPVYLEGDRLLAWPSGGGLRLWRDAVEALGLTPERMQRIPGERDKYLVPAEAVDAGVPLEAIFLLDRAGDAGVVPISGPERLATLMEQTYRPRYLQGLGVVADHLTMSCRIAEQVGLFTLSYRGPVGEGAELLSRALR